MGEINMNTKQGTGLRLKACHLAVLAALAVSSSTHAVTWEWGDWSGSWDNSISYGVSWRGEDPDPRLIGKGNGGTGEAILTDDGTLNYDQGDIFSNIVKGTSEIEFTNDKFGVFGRIKYWYDYELENGKVPHGQVANDYQPNTELNDDDFADYAQFSGLELLDLFVYGSFDMGEMPLDLRLGRQVVNWGEATFIQGINILNPIDVSAFRRPGAEIKEGLLPVALLYGNLGFGDGWSVEAFYQFKWEETVLDGCGTFYSDVDFVAKGCNELLAPEQLIQIPGVPPFYAPDSMLQNIHNTWKDPVVDQASDSGQFGLAVRKYVEPMDTEFGFYYQRLHSRTPVLNNEFATEAMATGSKLGGNPAPSYYQVAYPEDIDIWGLSFATNVGSIALSGEVSYKQDHPVAVNGTTELTAALRVVATQGQICLLPDPSLAGGQFAPRSCAAWADYISQGGPFNPEARAIALGYDRFDITQAQTTALYFWEQGLGAERVTFVGEVAWVGVDNLPSIAVMPYGRSPVFGSPTTGLGGPSDDGFVTSSSWGYRLRASASYPNAFAGVELAPSFAWAHDVSGTAPTGAFLDDRKAISLALGANYLAKYHGSLAYTWFTGGFANTQTDRDFFSVTFSLDF
jgi:hypothetical protein